MSPFRSIIYSLCACLAVCYSCSQAEIPSIFAGLEGPRSRLLLDDDWSFLPGEAQGADAVDFDDTAWRRLSLPHDWSIEDLPGTDSPIDPDAPGGISTGYYRGGTGWYRKNVFFPENLHGKRVFLQFDGIYMNADIWINGGHLVNHPYGYTSFWHDISDQIQLGQENLIAVRVINEGRTRRWYSG